MNHYRYHQYVFMLLICLSICNVCSFFKEEKDEIKAPIKTVERGNIKEDVDVPIYVINLKRSPDRLKFIDKQMKKYGLNYKRFEAVDGYDLKIIHNDKKYTAKDFRHGLFFSASLTVKIMSDLYKEANFYLKFSTMFFKCKSRVGRSISCGELAVIHSHRAVWLDIIKNNYDKAIIFEDDVLFKDDFKEKLLNILNNIPQNADIIMLGWNNYNLYEEKITPIKGNDFLGTYNGKTIMDGMYGYIISSMGAKKLLKGTENICLPLDTQMNFLRKKGEVMYYFPYKKIVTVNDDESIIKTMGRGF